MVIDDFDVARVPAIPAKALAVLIIDADPVLTSATTLQRLEVIPRRDSKFVERLNRVELG